MVSWAMAPVLDVLAHGQKPMVTFSKWLWFYVPGTTFSPAVDTCHSRRSLFCPTKQSPDGCFDFEVSVPSKLDNQLSGGGGRDGGGGGKLGQKDLNKGGAQLIRLSPRCQPGF